MTSRRGRVGGEGRHGVLQVRGLEALLLDAVEQPREERQVVGRTIGLP